MKINHEFDLESIKDLGDFIDWDNKEISGYVNVEVEIPDADILTEALDIIKKANITEFEDEQNELLNELIKGLDEVEKMELCELSYPPFTYTNLAEEILQEKMEEVWKDMQNGRFSPQQVEAKLQELY